MRLKQVYISDYKNLKEFELSLGSSSGIDVFVGKNGSGKSNIFEALIEIFRHLNEFESNSEGIDFSYRIAYEIRGILTEIEWANSQLRINRKSRKTVGKTPIPENVLIYYSGHNDTIDTLISSYQETFRRRIKRANFDESRYFIGFDSSYKKLILALSILRPESSPCFRFVHQKLGISKIGPELKLTLKRPLYASDPRYDVLSNDDANKYWGAKGITKDFLTRLEGCAAAAPSGGRIRTEGYIASDDEYILYLDPNKIRNAFENEAPHELFMRFDNLKVVGMLGDVNIPLELSNGEEANSAFFSDGQHQSVYIFAITEIFKERHCLTLLDEPDSFLHPEWQHEFLTEISEISDSAAQTNHTLLSSHSASTISSYDQDLIRLFEISGQSVSVSRVPKGEVISSLSSGLITFSEREARLSINIVLGETLGPVLFTEGLSDEIVLRKAWEKLYPGESCPVEIQNAFCCEFLSSLLRRRDIFDSHPERTFFGLFDFDSAYNQWNGCDGDLVQPDPSKCLAKKLKNKDGFCLLLPVPVDCTIKDQVVNPKTGQHYKQNSSLSMELLFYGATGLDRYFEIDPSRPGNVIRFKGDKIRFAKDVVPDLDAANFKVFEPIFDFIRLNCVENLPVAELKGASATGVS